MKLKMDKNVMIINYKQPFSTEYIYGDTALKTNEIISCYPDLAERLIDKDFAHKVE